MKTSKKTQKRLEIRIADYEKTISRLPMEKRKAFTKPGSLNRRKSK